MDSRQLSNREQLERSDIVANCLMNRERELLGTNGYEVEIGFDPLAWLEKRLARQSTTRWLDLCCGTGRALIEAAQIVDSTSSLRGRIEVTGVDLVELFYPRQLPQPDLVCSSIFAYAPTQKFDLITCIHGLHYLGDKLQALRLAASWLSEDGFFIGNLDVRSIKLSSAKSATRKILKHLRDSGFDYDARRHLISCCGRVLANFPFDYKGADDQAGPNYTGQPAVDSYYVPT